MQFRQNSFTSVSGYTLSMALSLGFVIHLSDAAHAVAPMHNAAPPLNAIRFTQVVEANSQLPDRNKKLRVIDAEAGIFVVKQNKTVLIARKGDIAPNSTLPFEHFCGGSAAGRSVVFCGNVRSNTSNDYLSGIYLQSGNRKPKLVVDRSSHVPYENRFFRNVSDPLIDGSTVVFREARGLQSPDHVLPSAIYVKQRRTIRRIIAEGQTLDGQTVQTISYDSQALRDRTLVFRVQFEDGSNATYKAEF
jgi:hypothetical protein